MDTSEKLLDTREKIESMDLRFLPDLAPLRSARLTEFLHHEKSRIDISKHGRERLTGLDKEDALRYGVDVEQSRSSRRPRVES